MVAAVAGEQGRFVVMSGNQKLTGLRGRPWRSTCCDESQSSVALQSTSVASARPIFSMLHLACRCSIQCMQVSLSGRYFRCGSGGGSRRNHHRLPQPRDSGGAAIHTKVITIVPHRRLVTTHARRSNPRSCDRPAANTPPPPPRSSPDRLGTPPSSRLFFSRLKNSIRWKWRTWRSSR